MRRLLKRVAIVIAILFVLGLIGSNVPDSPKHKSPEPKTKEEVVQRVAAEFGYSHDEVRRAINRFERNR